MLNFDLKRKEIKSTNGGYLNDGLPIRDTFVQLGSGMHYVHAMLYEPVVACERSRIGVIVVHSDLDYSTLSIGGELAKRGYRTLCGQVIDPKSTLDTKILDIKTCVEFFRQFKGIEKVVLMGHSGGATLMSAYQAIAENGAQVFQGDEKLVKCSIKEILPAADGLMLLDSNWGNGAMTLISIDPAVMEDGNGIKLDTELDIFNPANGYSPEGSSYNESFMKKYFKAQAERNNELLKNALERLHAIERGKGRFVDDEPFFVVGGEQFAPCNKLIPEDIHLVSHTKEPHSLLHADGTVTKEIIHCLRKPHFNLSMTPSIRACLIGTVRDYLTNRAVLAGEDYRIGSDSIEGIRWDTSYNCTPANVKHISVPLLVMGMTGSYEYLAAEAIYYNAKSTEKTICFVEGAGHNFFLEPGIETYAGQYGDTAKNTFDYAGEWMQRRFINE